MKKLRKNRTTKAVEEIESNFKAVIENEKKIQKEKGQSNKAYIEEMQRLMKVII